MANPHPPVEQRRRPRPTPLTRRADLDPGLAGDLAAALAARQIVPYYQPVIDLASGEVVGAEALSRWELGDGSLRTPDAFLDLVQATGRLRAMGRSVMEQACTAFAQAAPTAQGWWVAVNLSADDCVARGLPTQIEDCLERTGLEPCRLVVEISEQLVPGPTVNRALEAIRDLGVRVALDDYGSRYSSLDQLCSLPLDIVKLDRSMLRARSAEEAKVLFDTVALADSLGLGVVVEGIETPEQHLLAAVAGAGLAQGFLWGAAVRYDEFVATWPRTSDAAS